MPSGITKSTKKIFFEIILTAFTFGELMDTRTLTLAIGKWKKVQDYALDSSDKFHETMYNFLFCNPKKHFIADTVIIFPDTLDKKTRHCIHKFSKTGLIQSKSVDVGKRRIMSTYMTSKYVNSLFYTRNK